MAKSRHRFFTKLKILFFYCCAIVLSITIAANLTLAKNKNQIIQSLNLHFSKPIAVKNIFYLPPNIIILRNFSISESKTGQSKNILSIPLAYAYFPLSGLLLKRSLRISTLSVAKLVVEPNGFCGFLKDNFTQILDFITSLPKQDFRLSLRRISFTTVKNNTYSTGTKNSLGLKLEGDIFSASGYAGNNTFSLKGFLSAQGLNVENFKLSNGNINCQFRGNLRSNLAEFNGFIMDNGPAGNKATNSPKLFILDIDSRVKFYSGRIEVERLNFSLNKNPVSLTAEILVGEPFSGSLKLLSDFRSMDNDDSRLKKISLLAHFTFQKDQVIQADANLNIDFPEHKRKSLPIEKLRMEAKSLRLNFKDPSALKINVGTLNLFSKTSTNLYDINLEDLEAKVYQLGKTLKPVEFSSSFYGGRLEGRAKIETRDFLPVISASIKAENVDANKLEGILIHFSKIYGKLSSEMFFINYPQLVFKGALRINDGYLNNFEFLKWLANLFDLPALKKVGFHTAKADFLADQDGAGLYKMDLDSENLKIKGDFKLKEADLVASTISLSLRQELLRESAKFNALLRLLSTKQDWVKFNFQLSGNLHNMNFRWLKSDFKDDIQKAIPDFIERRLERKLENIIESIDKEKGQNNL